MGLSLVCSISVVAEDLFRVERIHPDKIFTEVDSSGWGLSTDKIVVMSMGMYPDELDEWSFGQNEIGIVNALSLQVRDRLGMLDAKFAMQDQSIYVNAGGRRLRIAKVGESDPGDLDTGRDGQNVHWKLDFMTGIRVVAEDSRSLQPYSLFLPATFEELVQQAETCPGVLAGP